MNDQSPTTIVQPSSDAKAMMRFEAEKKSPGIALVLCWVLGMFGAHRFYAGKTGSAVAMLLITILSIPLTAVFGLGLLGLFATAIWEFVDLFSVTTWVKTSNVALMEKIASGQL
jgi:TM2 domain-containing membrane protein YozV